MTDIHADIEIQGIAGRYRWALGCPCKACAEVMKIAKSMWKHQQKRLTKKHHIPGSGKCQRP